MNKCLYCLLILALFCMSGFAQQPEGAGGPPKILLIVREDIKPGMMAAHGRHSAQYAAMFGKLGTPNHRIALIPVAGSENEVLYLTGADTFAEIEKINQETDKKMTMLNAAMQADADRLEKEAPGMHAGMRDILVTYRPELSFKPGINLPSMRYFAITTIRVRPGQDDQFAEYIRNAINAAREKANADLHIAAFSTVAGLPGGTYLFFRPLKSLAEYDARIGAKVRESMSDDQKKKADKMAADTIMTSETSIYAMNPQMSYMPKEFIAADPAFWSPKAPVAVKPKPKPKKPAPPPPPPAGR
jgi:hypothetical protein